MTVTVFKNLAMLRRSTDQHPIFLGPMYIHGSSTNVDYSFFFDHLRSVLDAPSPPLVGSDDEKAIKKLSPKLGQMANNCHRHLYQNCVDHLQRKIGMNDTDRKPLLAAIFGNEGVTAAEGRVVFDERLTNAQELADQSAFGTYFKNRIVPMLQHNIDVTLHSHCPSTVTTRWTNNNSESANHTLKIAVDWKPQSLLSLIEHLSNVVQSQYEEVERAIINTSDFKLDPHYGKFKVHRDTWRNLSLSDRDNHLKKFRKTLMTPKKQNRLKRQRYECGR